MLVNPHKCKISLALDDQGEIVPRRGMIIIIRNTYHQHPEGLLSVYSDNSAVMEGYEGERFYAE
jgi:hypothetical protein